MGDVGRDGGDHDHGPGELGVRPQPSRCAVEFAQASLALQAMSAGRVDAGLDAGWDDAESSALGERFPPGAERSERLGEDVAIARALFEHGRFVHQGRWYAIDAPSIAPGVRAPPGLIAAATGRLTVNRVIDYVDLLELKAPGFSVPGRGPIDTTAMAAARRDDLRRAIDDARSRRPDVRVSTLLPAGCTDDPVVGALRRRLGESVFAPLFGPPGEVADAVRAIAELGFDRLQLVMVTAGSPAALAPLLLDSP